MMKKHRMLNGLKKFVKFYNKNYIDIVAILVIALLLVIFTGATFAYGDKTHHVAITVKIIFIAWAAVLGLSLLIRFFTDILDDLLPYFDKQNRKYIFRKNKTKIHKIDSIHKIYTAYPEIKEKIREIDEKLEDGYVFSGITVDRWETAYKQEILDLISTEYDISEENQQKIMNLLKRLKESLINKKEKEFEFQTEVNIDAMERIADMDLADDGSFSMKK